MTGAGSGGAPWLARCEQVDLSLGLHARFTVVEIRCRTAPLLIRENRVDVLMLVLTLALVLLTWGLVWLCEKV